MIENWCINCGTGLNCYPQESKLCISCEHQLEAEGLWFVDDDTESHDVTKFQFEDSLVNKDN